MKDRSKEVQNTFLYSLHSHHKRIKPNIKSIQTIVMSTNEKSALSSDRIVDDLEEELEKTNHRFEKCMQILFTFQPLTTLSLSSTLIDTLSEQLRKKIYNS